MNQNMTMNPEQGVDAIKAYGINLTNLAKRGKIDPVIGRDEEIRRIVQILSRRTKNNPVLIGEPGTGKTTVVEGLAKRIVEGDVPENMKNKQVVTLDISAMIAGASYRGQFEDRLKNFIKQVVESDGEIIVFIDELHMIVGAGGMEGQMDLSNMIKPELARGRMKVVGATTLNEYQKYIEKDAALERRFQLVYIAEPTVEDTITILRGIKDRYELHHGLHIKDAALIAAATLSQRYITDRFLPDKAVDLMDEAASKIRMEMNSAPAAIDDLRRRILHLEVEREALKREKDSRSKQCLQEVNESLKKNNRELQDLTLVWEEEKKTVQNIQRLKEKQDQLRKKAEMTQRDGNFQMSAKILYDEIPRLEKEIDAATETMKNNRFVKLEVDMEDVADIVSKWTGIPVSKVMAGEKERLLHLEEKLKERVLGQDQALKRVSDVIRMSKLGVLDQHRPIGSFLFMGNTGVGKTELAKSLAELLFDSDKALIRLDMSEFMEAHSVSKMIGSPPGYVGYNEGGHLTEKIRRRPYAVILLDEVEKAHPAVLNILLQILDDGRLTDAKGRTVNFSNTIVIMTSNMKREELSSVMRPELINRIDEILMFNDLDQTIIRDIVTLHLNRVIANLKHQDILLETDTAVHDYIVQNGYDPTYGARPIRRIIRRELLARLSIAMLEHSENNRFRVTVREGESITVMPVQADTLAA
ncbi:MAG: ATP-dependent Clp protease ATP-binding subunit [Fidelibacterota bacterium]